MLDKLNLKTKLVVGFGLLLAILVALGVASYRTIVSIDEAANEVDLKTTERELAIAQIGAEIVRATTMQIAARAQS